eukprot:CAMPEP_0115297212 /NCGR_PEP_ID=MMETSP0270-20121206/67633_1 /TAXON_ID=71861 /ORGANISM="Scrippsiella trochoidea, Strain CCMP3099" /LENGTH=331 /DNA_ID=CAMNT_0002714865 /DNA_START=25 /DNA_END=1017 /DNA_ORIENTATION=+
MAHRLGRHGRRNRTLGATLLHLLCCSWCFGRKQHVEVVTQPAFVSGDFVKQAAPPIGALTLGFGLYLCSGGSKSTDTAATVLIYFGAQTGMNLYMKTVLSKIVINEEENLKGLPIGFLLTAVQQFVAFLAFCCFLVVGKIIGKGYRVKKLTSAREYLAVICFSVTFALNIGLNNFSLSLVAISINLIIRSCLPLSTAISQMLVGSLVGQQQKSIALMEWILMFVGVGCAALATYAKNMAGSSTEESAGLVLGVICCVASLFSGAFNMVLAGILGSELKLNPQPVAFSGILAFFYNILQYTLVHKLSAAYAAFAGNFNKAATVALSLALGLE